MLSRLALLLITFTLAGCKSNDAPDWEYVHPELRPYYEDFLRLVGDKADKGETVYIQFSTNLPHSILGVAFGMDSNVTHIQINGQRWLNMTSYQRRMTMYHELAHDLLDWKHDNGTVLMAKGMPRYVDQTTINTITKELKNGW